MKGNPPTPTGRFGGQGCECFDMTNGKRSTTGVCVQSNKCEGKTTGEGKGVGLGQAGQIMQQAMQGIQQALQGMGGGGGGGGGQQGGQQGGQGMGGLGSGLFGNNTPWTSPTGCAGTQYDVNYPSTDPCAHYTQPASQSLLGGSSLLNALTGGQDAATQSQSTSANDSTTQTSASENLLQGAGSNTQAGSHDVGTANTSQTPASSGTGTSAGRATTSTGVFVPGNVGGLTPDGARGDITTDQGGLTVTAGTRDAAGNTEVAGFLGASTGGASQSQGVVGRWCATRPWATNFLSKIVAPTFFDGLCTWRGYKVGQEPVVPNNTDASGTAPVTVLQQERKPATTKASAKQATTTGPVAPGRVQIWAVPATVSLGSRTSVFWTTENVTSCTETSPDGSFNQSSLSGGASTVPLTGPTVFSISCLDGGGNPVTNSVTVTIRH